MPAVAEDTVQRSTEQLRNFLKEMGQAYTQYLQVRECGSVYGSVGVCMGAWECVWERGSVGAWWERGSEGVRERGSEGVREWKRK